MAKEAIRRSRRRGCSTTEIRPVETCAEGAGASKLLSRRAAIGVDSAAQRSFYVLMQIESLSEALAAGWRVHARCIEGIVDNTRLVAKCRYQAELSLETLVWTRGRNMSLSGLRERMMCPRCGNRRVNLIFDPPPVAKRAPVA
jgi:hypothetical protein